MIAHIVPMKFEAELDAVISNSLGNVVSKLNLGDVTTLWEGIPCGTTDRGKRPIAKIKVQVRRECRKRRS